MEPPTQYWTWNGNNNLNLQPRPPPNLSCSSHEDSWEEQAFAEDAAGPHGGCIWPPRSYSCTFCRREFRSAQALGGHMNVHRRDRARLKQSPHTHPMEIPIQSSSSLPIYHFSHNPYPPPDLPTSSSSSPPLQPYNNPARVCSTDKSFFLSEEEKRKRKRPPEEDMTSLNLVLWQSSESTASLESEHDGRGKRRRVDDTTSLTGIRRREDMLEIRNDKKNSGGGGAYCAREELDLELRLGDRPQVKSI